MLYHTVCKLFKSVHNTIFTIYMLSVITRMDNDVISSLFVATFVSQGVLYIFLRDANEIEKFSVVLFGRCLTLFIPTMIVCISELFLNQILNPRIIIVADLVYLLRGYCFI